MNQLVLCGGRPVLDAGGVGDAFFETVGSEGAEDYGGGAEDGAEGVEEGHGWWVGGERGWGCGLVVKERSGFLGAGRGMVDRAWYGGILLIRGVFCIA